MVVLNRKLLLISILIVVILVTAYQLTPEEEGSGHAQVTLIIDFGDSGSLHKENITVWENGRIVSSVRSEDNSTVFEFRRLPGENMTVFDVLVEASHWGNFSLEYTDHDFPEGKYIDSIADVENGEKDWEYSVNGVYGERACDRKFVNDEDIIEWKYGS